MQRNAEKYYEILNSKVVTLHLASLNSAESFTNCRLSWLYPFQFAIAQWLRKRPSQLQWIHDQFACARKHNHMSLTQDLWRRLDAQRNLPLWSIVSVCQQHNNSNPPENDLIFGTTFFEKISSSPEDESRSYGMAMVAPGSEGTSRPQRFMAFPHRRNLEPLRTVQPKCVEMCAVKKKMRNRLWSEIISLYIYNEFIIIL